MSVRDSEDPSKVHEEAVVIDACCPLWFELGAEPPKYLDLCRKGGYTAVAPTAGGSENAAQTFRKLGVWHRFIRENPDDVLLVRTAQDVLDAKATGRIGIILHFQGTESLEDSIDLVDSYKTMGVGIIQIAYNARNRFCDGSEEPGNAGLSKLGRRLIKRMNEARVIVDCSHTGERSTLEAIEACERITILSHANVRAVHDVPRNVSDEIIKAIAANGGVIGTLAYPPFVADKKRPDLDDFINHIDHIAQLVGIDHVGLALDYFHWQHPFATAEEQIEMHRKQVEKGAWDPRYYTTPPYYYPTGIETPDQMPNVSRRLLERGYSAEDVHKVMGMNWVRGSRW